MLGILDFKTGQYGYYDSLGQNLGEVQRSLKRLASTLRPQSNMVFEKFVGPRQQDDFNCGVFALIGARSYIASGSLNPFMQANMTWPTRRWREEIHEALLTGSLQQ